MSVTVTINGTDLASLGLEITEAPDWLDAPKWSQDLATIPGRVGGVFSGPVKVGARDLGLVGVLRAATLSARRTAEDAIKDLLAGTVALQVDDGVNPVREIRGVCYQSTFRALGHPLVPLVHGAVSLALTCPDGMWRDPAVRVIGFGASATALPLGTGPSTPIVRLFGAATNPTLTYRAASGVVVATMAFTATLGASDYLEIDASRATITRSTAGVVTNGMSLLTSGSFFALDPRDGSYGASSWPTLEVSAGTGEAIYVRQWL